jgi:hypothetical protein
MCLLLLDSSIRDPSLLFEGCSLSEWSKEEQIFFFNSKTFIINLGIQHYMLLCLLLADSLSLSNIWGLYYVLLDSSIRVYHLRGVAYLSGARGIDKNDFIKKGISRTFTLKIGIRHFKLVYLLLVNSFIV